MNKPPNITLQAWAERSFVPAPELQTLRAWARSGKIQPAPIKVGRTWMVDPGAEYCAEPAQTTMPSGLSARAMGILLGG